MSIETNKLVNLGDAQVLYNDLRNRIENGTQDNLTAGSVKQLLSTTGTDNSVPYLYRANPTDADRAVMEKIVGGTVAWNQQAKELSANNYEEQTANISYSNGIATFTATAGYGGPRSKDNMDLYNTHKYYMSFEYTSVSAFASGSLRMSSATSSITLNVVPIQTASFIKVSSIVACSASESKRIHIWDTRSSNNTEVKVRNAQIIDLTQMFGSTIADYIYGLETGTAGAGVAFFRKLFPNAYYAYDAGSLQSVKTSGKKTYDADNHLIAEYPISNIELRGIVKKDTNNNLYYDGDEYASNGTVTRKYGIVDLGTLTWVYNDSISAWTGTPLPPNYVAGGYIRSNMTDYTQTFPTDTSQNGIRINSTYNIWYRNGSTTVSPTGEAIYKLNTPTSESADPFQRIEIAGTTEEFIDSRDVPIPVGHETFYPYNLRKRVENIPDAPTSNGTYRLQVTVTNGVPIYGWSSV